MLGHSGSCRGVAGGSRCVGKGLERKKNAAELFGRGQAVMDFTRSVKNFGLRAVEQDTFKPRNDMLRLMWQSGEGTVIGEVAGKPIRKRQRSDLPSSCHFPNSLRGDGPGLAGK